MANSVLVSPISGNPTITTEKLNGKNYLSWSASVELWFLGQGYHDHLEKEASAISSEERSKWEKLDFQLCAILWQSVEPNILNNLRTYKTCSSFWKKAQSIFANDIQRLYDSANKITSLKQTNHDMISHMSEAQSAVQELKMFLEDDTVEGMKQKLDKLCMVLILRTLHPDFKAVRDQILTGHEIPSMDSLVTRLLRVPTEMTGDNPTATIETSVMVAGRGRGRGNRGGRDGRGGRPYCSYCKRLGHTQETCYSLHGFPKKTANVSKIEKPEPKFSDEEYQEFLKWKSSNQVQCSSAPNASRTCISQSVDSPSSWIIDSGASDHMSSNESLFFSKAIKNFLTS